MLPDSTLHEIDVRPLCAVQRPPLPAILAAVQELRPGQGLRLLAPFEPVPLYTLMQQRGFGHETIERSEGVWEIIFRPTVMDAGGE